MKKLHILTFVFLSTASALFTMDDQDHYGQLLSRIDYAYALDPTQAYCERMETDMIYPREFSPYQPGQDPIRGEFLPLIVQASRLNNPSQVIRHFEDWRQRLQNPTQVEMLFIRFFVRNYNTEVDRVPKKYALPIHKVYRK